MPPLAGGGSCVLAWEAAAAAADATEHTNHSISTLSPYSVKNTNTISNC